MGGHVDMNQIFFTNLLLLDFDPAAMERKWRIPFNKDMFVLPNKKGFESVMYFLFNCLNATKCKEIFRDCWPVCDKKQEQLFRRSCHTWLSQIAQEDAEAVLPRIVASTFMSPGGHKFVELLMYFSTYILLKVSQNNYGLKRRHILHHPVITSQIQSSGLPSAMLSVIQCSVVRLRKKLFAHAQQTSAMQDKWREYAVNQVKKYRSLTKACREKETRLRSEISQISEQGTLNGSPLSLRRKSGSCYDYDIQSVKRTQKVQNVRDLWHSLDEYLQSTSKDKQVIDSLLEGNLDKCKVDASDLNVKIPDMLLRQCEQEIHRRGVENIYIGGKLNLLSLIHLWNLSLHLYIDRLSHAGRPQFEESMPRLTSELNTHQHRLNNLQSLRIQLEREVLPQLKDSIKMLKAKLEKELIKNKSPDSLRQTSLGFGLLPQTPPVGFEPDDTGTPTANFRLSLSPEQVATPDGVAELIRDVCQQVQTRHQRQTEQESTLSPRTRRGTTGLRFMSDSALYGDSNMEKTDYKQQTNLGPTSKAKLDKPSISKSGIPRQRTKALVPQNERRVTSKPQRQLRGQDAHPSDNKQIRAAARMTMPTGQDDRTERQTSEVNDFSGQSQTVEDVLADKIAEAMIRPSPEDARHLQDAEFLQDPLTYLHSNDADPFCSRDILSHTPPKTSHKAWHEPLLHDSLGPLSSTRMDQSARINVDRRPTDSKSTDPLATKLFTFGEFDHEGDAQTENSEKISSRLASSRQNVAHVRTGSPLVCNLPSSISSISPQSDRSSTKSSGKRQSTMLNEVELEGGQEEATLEADLGCSSGSIVQPVHEDLEIKHLGSSGGHSRSPSSTNRSFSFNKHQEGNAQSGLDPEDSVRVIQFQDGAFREFLDMSPAKRFNKSTSDVHQQASSPSNLELRAMKEQLDRTTESLLSQYQQLASVVQSPQRSRKSQQRSGQSPQRSGQSPQRSGQSPQRSDQSPQRSSQSPQRSSQSPQRSSQSPQRSSQLPQRFLTENDLLWGGARPKPLPLISKTPTMSFLDSYMNCSPPPGKYGNVIPTDDSQSWLQKKLTLDWDTESDDNCHSEGGRTSRLDGSFGGQDQGQGHLIQESPRSAQVRTPGKKHLVADSLSQHCGDLGLFDNESGLLEEGPVLLSDDLELSLSKSGHNSLNHQDGSFSPILRSSHLDTPPKSELRQDPSMDLFSEDASCLMHDSPRVGKLIDI